MISKKKIKELKEMEYKKYLTTDYWKMVSEQAKHNANYKCQLCGKTNCQLNVHHNTYEHKGEEFLHMEDLICLCKECHESFHNQCKTIKQQEKSIEKLENEYAILKYTIIIYLKHVEDLMREKEYLQNELDMWRYQMPQHIFSEMNKIVEKTMPQHTLSEMYEIVEEAMQDYMKQEEQTIQHNSPLPF